MIGLFRRNAPLPEDFTRFLIMGLPRSGTTYLFTLLNAHSQVVCHGERFNPRKIIENQRSPARRAAGQAETVITDERSLLERDADPVPFFEEGMDPRPWSYRGVKAAGYKYMIGHHPELMPEGIAAQEDIALIFVRRENKLAQVASLLHAIRSKEWASSKKTEAMPPLKVDPLRISARMNELESRDFLFGSWVDRLPHARKLTVEYREMFLPGFEERLCAFLRVPYEPGMKSPLVKQGVNRVIERFENRKPIRRYMRLTGRRAWLGDELADPDADTEGASDTA